MEAKVAAWRAFDESDQGAACLYTQAPNAFDSASIRAHLPEGYPNPKMLAKAGQPLFVLVEATQGCASSSCTRMKVKTCKVEQSGNDLRITSHLAYEVHENGPCTDDCRFITASCKTPKLKAGRYTVHLGDQTFSATVPGDIKAACTP